MNMNMKITFLFAVIALCCVCGNEAASFMPRLRAIINDKTMAMEEIQEITSPHMIKSLSRRRRHSQGMFTSSHSKDLDRKAANGFVTTMIGAPTFDSDLTTCILTRMKTLKRRKTPRIYKRTIKMCMMRIG